MVSEINLLRQYPKAKRNITHRHQVQEENRAIAKQFGEAFFNGERDQGYGGYRYDGRWVPVAQDFVEHWGLKPGDRVAYKGGAPGAYSDAQVMAVDELVKIPRGISDEEAAAMMLKGMTVQYLLRSTVALNAGDTVLFHAAAGGVGLIACQWAKHLGVTMIGTVGSEEKAELARAHGCTHTVLYNEENFVDRVRELTDGKGVDAVYDSVGRQTFSQSLDCLRTRGTLVLFGQSSGKVEPIDPAVLSAKGSLFLTRPTLFNYTASREDLLHCASELFDVLQKGVVKADINQEYPLSEAQRAHEDLEGRRTTGASLLLP